MSSSPPQDLSCQVLTEIRDGSQHTVLRRWLTTANLKAFPRCLLTPFLPLLCPFHIRKTAQLFTIEKKKKKKEREWFWGGVVGSSEVELYTSTIPKVLKLKTRNQPFRTFKGAEITFNTMTGKPSKRWVLRMITVLSHWADPGLWGKE